MSLRIVGDVIDNQITGARDNGTEQGVVDVHPLDGDMVVWPLRDGMYVTGLTGSATSSYQRELLWQGPHRCSTSVLLTVPVGANAATLRTTFWGTKVGIVFWRNSTQTALGPFTVQVDGDATAEVIPALNYGDTQAATAANFEPMALVPLFKDLKDGFHELTFRFVPDITNSWSWNIIGLLVDRRAGYLPPTEADGLDIVNTLTTANTAMITQGWMVGLMSVMYYNTTGTNRTVTIAMKGADAFVIPVPANGTAYFPPWGTFNRPVNSARSGSSIFAHRCDANSAVIATIVGRPF